MPHYFAGTTCLSWGFFRRLFLKTGRARISLTRFAFLDNASRLPFSVPTFSLVPGASQEFLVRPAEAFNPNSSTFRWILSLSNFFSNSRWVSFHCQHVEIGNDRHECICFQTCNHDIRDDVENRTTMFFILPAIDEEFSAWVPGLAFTLFKLFSSVCFFTFGTEEYACSRWEFLASLHFIPRCPYGLPWHACVENYTRLFLNKTQLSSAENILQSSARCKSFSPFLSCHGSTLGNFVGQKSNIVAPFQVCRHHQIQSFIIREIFSHNWFWIDEVLQRAGCFDLLIHCHTSARFFAFAQIPAWKFTIQLWNSVWSRIFCRCISEER